MNANSDETTESDRPLPSNAIAASVSDEQPEYAGGERMYAVLFAEDHEGVSLDANGDVAVLLDREQAKAARETIDEIVAALGGEREATTDGPRIVLDGMDVDERRAVVEGLANSGVNEEIVVVGDGEVSVGELRDRIAEAVDDARESGVPEDVISEVTP